MGNVDGTAAAVLKQMAPFRPKRPKHPRLASEVSGIERTEYFVLELLSREPRSLALQSGSDPLFKRPIANRRER